MGRDMSWWPGARQPYRLDYSVFCHLVDILSHFTFLSSPKSPDSLLIATSKMWIMVSSYFSSIHLLCDIQGTLLSLIYTLLSVPFFFFLCSTTKPHVAQWKYVLYYAGCLEPHVLGLQLHDSGTEKEDIWLIWASKYYVLSQPIALRAKGRIFFSASIGSCAFWLQPCNTFAWGCDFL